MKKNLLLLTTMLIAIFLSSCAKIFYTPDAKFLASNHKTIAIVSPTVSIAATKKVDGDALIAQQKGESLNFQKEMYAWLLKRKRQGKLFQEIQDIQTTNAKLSKAGYPENPLTTSEICEILGVDGIMTSNFALSKPISTGGAIAMAFLLGAAGPTNEIRVSLSISDCNNTKLIWNYDHKYSGGLGSSPARLVDAMMKKATKKMPYFIKN